MKLQDDEIHALLSDIDVAYNGQLELADYLQVSWLTFLTFLIPFQQEGEKEVPGEQLHEILREIDTNMNGQVELDEYLQVRSFEYCELTHFVAVWFYSPLVALGWIFFSHLLVLITTLTYLCLFLRLTNCFCAFKACINVLKF